MLAFASHRQIWYIRDRKGATAHKAVDLPDCYISLPVPSRYKVGLLFIFAELFKMEDVTKLMPETASFYQTNSEIQKVTDSVWGEGATTYLGKVIEVTQQAQAPSLALLPNIHCR